MSSAGRVLVVAAHPAELAPVGALPAGWSRAVVGVGLVEAAIGTALLLSAERPDGLVLVGSAGLYPEPGGGPSGGDRLEPAWGERVVVADEVRWVSADVESGRAARPEVMPDRLACHRPWVEGIEALGCERESVATVGRVTVSDTRAAELARTGCRAENLEAFAVARAAARWAPELPFVAVLGLTNRVGAQGREQWRRHHLRAAEIAARCLEAWARTLALV